MSISDGFVASPAQLVGEVCDAISELGEVLWAAKTSQELLEANAEIERLRAVAAAVQLRLATEIDAGDHAKLAGGWQSTADYLTFTAGGLQSGGKRMLRTGRALCSELAATMEALAAAVISEEQAHVIADLIRHLPVDTELRALAEKVLLREAPHLNATELRVAGNSLLEHLDPDGHAKREEKKLDQHERSAHLNRFLNIVDDGLGGVKLRGRGTVEDAAVIRAALASLAAPAAKDLADADPECGTAGRDTRDHGARTWDALVDVCQKAIDADVLPTNHGTKTRVTVTISYEALKSGIGTATLESGDRISAAAVRRLACDADLIPMMLGTTGEPLDVGRRYRLVTVAIWLALIARDKHCAFPGCRRPPVACDAHHVTHWVDGGKTALRELVMLCRAHHTIIHSTDWQVRINDLTGLPEFKPPPSGRRVRDALLNQVDQTGDGWVRERTRRG
jgi:hypothetical protein